MLRNYIMTAWRSLVKGRLFSIINITGLAIGMAGAALIVLWLHHEISFDKFHGNKDRLYEVYGSTNIEGKKIAINQTSQPLVPAIKKDFPEVEDATRFAPVNNFLFTANEKKLHGIEGAFVDPAFLKMFSFPFTQGLQDDNADHVYSIVITQSLARKLFGTEDVINKIIQIDSSDQFKVSGVLKNIPSNSRFHFEYLLPFSYLKKSGWNNESWLSNNISSFVLLKSETDPTAFERK